MRLDGPGVYKSQLALIDSGPQGVLQTLRRMRDIVRKYKIALPVRITAMKIVRSLPQKAWSAEARALFRFVRDEIRFVRDVRGVETLQTPDKTLELRAGDCDDKSMLLAAMLESIGHPTRFVAVGFQPNHFEHVYVETKIGNDWIALDPTEPVDMGWSPKRVVSRMVVYN